MASDKFFAWSVLVLAALVLVRLVIRGSVRYVENRNIGKTKEYEASLAHWVVNWLVLGAGAVSVLSRWLMIGASVVSVVSLVLNIVRYAKE